MVIVLYGSQTGNARESAYEFSEACSLAGLKITMTAPIDDVDMFSLCKTSQLIVFFISTTGQGEMPDNMRATWAKLIVSDLADTCLENLKFTLFGLGDSRYQQYNFAARKFRARLNQLGAKEVSQYGLGDDQHDFGFEGELDPWSDLTIRSLCDLAGIEMRNQPALAQSFPPIYKVKVIDYPVANSKKTSDPGCPYGSNKHCPFGVATVAANHRMTAKDHFQSVHDIKVSLPLSLGLSSECPLTNRTLPFSSGDTLVVYPEQPEFAVMRLLQCQDLAPDTLIKVSLNEEARDLNPRFPQIGSPFPETPITVRELFMRYVDICSYASRHLLRTMRSFARMELHINKLTELTGQSPESKDAFYEYVKSERRASWEVIEDFSLTEPENACRIPLEYLLSSLPLIVPRKYSISSAPSRYHPEAWPAFARTFAAPAFYPDIEQDLAERLVLSPGVNITAMVNSLKTRIPFCSTSQRLVASRLPCPVSPIRKEDSSIDLHLCVAVVTHKTKLQRLVDGVCSHFLTNLQPGARFRARIEPSISVRGITPNEPSILIGPGTGVAPVASLAEERVLAWSLKAVKEGKDIVQNIYRDQVFLGIRHRHDDFLYKTLWKLLQNTLKDNLLEINVAVSRENPEKKIYVQDKLEERWEGVVERLLTEQTGRVLICGRSHPMPDQVRRIIEEILTEKAGMDVDDSAEFIRWLGRERRFVNDTWG